MYRTFDRFARLVAEAPWTVFLFILLITGVALVGYYDADRVRSFVLSMFQEEVEQKTDDDDIKSPDVESVSLADSDATLVIESPGELFFTQDGSDALRKIAENLDDLPQVESVLWMDRLPILNMFGFPRPLLPRAESSEARFKSAAELAHTHPLVGGQMLSKDGKTLLMLIKFEWLFVDGDEDVTTELRRVAEETVAEFPGLDYKFYVTGRVPYILKAIQTQTANSSLFLKLGYGMIAVMAMVLFRGPTAVFIVALAPALGVFWTQGFVRFFDLQHNPFNEIVLPVLISLIGLTDGVHLMVQIRKLRASGLSGREAARRGLSEVGLACFLTSLTTAIGFGSLSLATSKIVQEFGQSCVIGVILTFVSVICVIPLACTTVLGRTVHIGHEKGLIDRNLGKISGVIDFVLPRARGLSWLAIVSTVVLTAISLFLPPDDKGESNVPRSAEAAVGMDHMDKAFGGLNFCSVDVRWSKQVESDSAEVLQVVTEVSDLLETEEMIGQPLSIQNFVDYFPGDGKPSERMSMLELLPPPLKRAFYRPERRLANVTFRVQELGIAAYDPVFKRLEAGLEKIDAAHPEFTLHMTGGTVERWRTIFEIVLDLAASLGSALVIIFLVLTIVYRSLTIGLISMLANIFPLALTGTVLVCAGQSLEVVTVLAFTVCLGIAVDDSIHFITRFQEERLKGGSDAQAIRRAFTAVGTALVMTTAVLITGFSVVLFSGLRDYQLFVAMGILTIGSALFADIIFLPALVYQFFSGNSPSDIADAETQDEPKLHPGQTTPATEEEQAAQANI
ncbi:MAG: efflux RND transporter permease subunit [Planctomycetaceae bacterium]